MLRLSSGGSTTTQVTFLWACSCRREEDYRTLAEEPDRALPEDGFGSHMDHLAALRQTAQAMLSNAIEPKSFVGVNFRAWRHSIEMRA